MDPNCKPKPPKRRDGKRRATDATWFVPFLILIVCLLVLFLYMSRVVENQFQLNVAALQDRRDWTDALSSHEQKYDRLMDSAADLMKKDAELETLCNRLDQKIEDWEGRTQSFNGVVDAKEHSSARQWLDTGIVISENSILDVLAYGEINICLPGDCRYDPKGNLKTPLPWFSLIGKVGATGEPFFLGTSYRQLRRDRGTLYLACHDSDWENNGGEGFRVAVSVTETSG